MNVVASDHVIQDLQSVSFFRLIEPLEPSVPVFGKPEQKFPFVTPVRDVPDVPVKIMSFGSGHG
jgi:hypothetical protein